MKLIILALFLGLSAKAAITIEELDSVFVTNEEIGPMAMDKIIKLDMAFRELAIDHYILDLQDKLGRSEFEFLPSIIHVCKLKGDTLGTYQRGEINTKSNAILPNDDVANLSVFWEDSKIEEAIEKSYKHYISNQGAYISLVIQKWPVICIRPGKSFQSVIATFAHEIQHYLGDEETSLDFRDYKNELDFVDKELVRSGGEYEAYQASGMTKALIQFHYQVDDHSGINQFFNEYGELSSSEDLKKYILNKLKYKTKFINKYRKGIIESYNTKVNLYNSLIGWFSLYENNLKVNKSNLEIYRNNIKVYEKNIEYYTYYQKLEKVEELKADIEQAKQNIIKTDDAIRFYQNMIEIKYSSLEPKDKELTELDILIQNQREL